MEREDVLLEVVELAAASGRAPVVFELRGRIRHEPSGEWVPAKRPSLSQVKTASVFTPYRAATSSS